jgi:hypothetical protein
MGYTVPMKAPLAALLGLLAMTGCATGRPAIVSRRAWGSKPQAIPESRRQVPKYVTLHHSGELWEGKKTPEDFVRNMQAWGWKDKGWPDLPYHFLIAPDGRIFEGRPVRYEPESNTRYPLAGNIGVEMMGDFERQRPSPAQLESAARLTAWLVKAYGLDPRDIRGHKDAAPGQTVCPGRDFSRYLDDGSFRNWVEELLAGKVAAVKPGPPLPEGPKEIIPSTATQEEHP